MEVVCQLGWLWQGNLVSGKARPHADRPHCTNYALRSRPMLVWSLVFVYTGWEEEHYSREETRRRCRSDGPPIVLVHSAALRRARIYEGRRCSAQSSSTRAPSRMILYMVCMHAHYNYKLPSFCLEIRTCLWCTFNLQREAQKRHLYKSSTTKGVINIAIADIFIISYDCMISLLHPGDRFFLI